MMRLIFFPAARLIDPVSSEKVPRFPSESRQTSSGGENNENRTPPKIQLSPQVSESGRAAHTRWCSAPSSLLPVMSAGHNRRKRTGRTSYLLMPGFLCPPHLTLIVQSTGVSKRETLETFDPH